MDAQMGLFEAIYNCRAMRRLKPDPVPQDLLVRLIDAANQAPSGSNMQNGRWIVVRDPEQKARLAELNKAGGMAYAGPQSGRPASLPHHSEERRQGMLASVLWQAEHLQEVPAIVIACLEFAVPP